VHCDLNACCNIHTYSSQFKLMCQNEWGQTARNDQFKDLIGVQYPFTKKQYKPA